MDASPCSPCVEKCKGEVTSSGNRVAFCVLYKKASCAMQPFHVHPVNVSKRSATPAEHNLSFFASTDGDCVMSTWRDSDMGVYQFSGSMIENSEASFICLMTLSSLAFLQTHRSHPNHCNQVLRRKYH